MKRKYRDPSYAGCSVHTSCLNYGHCDCGSVARGPEGKCPGCKNPPCKECGGRSISSKQLCVTHFYNAPCLQCGKAAGRGRLRLCGGCKYPTCSCGNRTSGPHGLCLTCARRDVECVVPGCALPWGSNGGGAAKGMCPGHSSRMHKYNDCYPDVALHHRVPGLWENRRSTVYVAVSDLGTPLYVGSSFGNGESRHQWHRRNQPWASQIDHFVIASEHPTRGAAYDAERALIEELSKTHTLYNKVWNHRPEETH